MHQQVTRKYELFQLAPFNRELHKLKRLRDSMKAHGFIPAYPLHVFRNGNGKLQIKAGHHRFEVAKELGLPIHYVVCDDSATIAELENATTPWVLKDYAASFVRMGSQPHIDLLGYTERTGVSLSQAAAMLAGEGAGSGNLLQSVKNGTFEIRGREHAEAVGAIVVKCREIGIVFAAHRALVAALSNLVRLGEFDANTFLHRLAVNPGMLKKQPNMNAYLEAIEAVYNHGARSRVALAFLAKEAAAKRMPIKTNKSEQQAKP